VDCTHFHSLTVTGDEQSVVCLDQDIPGDVRKEGGWRLLKIRGPLAFTLVGILSSLISPLATAGISIFALSTFDTDYLLIKAESFSAACQILTQRGHVIYGGDFYDSENATDTGHY
jgi:hypothetical protein